MSLKISVLTPSYNSSEFIERAIESVLNQDYANYEHIIIDGGSSDNTIEILKEYTHLKWVSEKDKGQSDAMNKAFKLSTGDIIVYLNADDYFERNTFKEVIQLFNTNEEIDIIIGNLYFTYHNNSKRTLVNSEYKFLKVLLNFKYGFPYNPVCYFYKREVQESIGDFPINEHYAMDYWFLIRALSKFPVHKTPKVLGNYFDTGCNKSSVNENDNITPIVKQFISGQNKLQLYYYSNKVLFTLLYVTPLNIYTYFKFLVFKSKHMKCGINFKSFKLMGFKAASKLASSK